MIARKCQYHHGLHGGYTIDWHDSFGYATDSQDSSLGRIDDGVESVNIVHAQVANGERAIADVLRMKLTRLRFRHQFSAPPGNLAQAKRIRLRENRNHQ